MDHERPLSTGDCQCRRTGVFDWSCGCTADQTKPGCAVQLRATFRSRGGPEIPRGVRRGLGRRQDVLSAGWRRPSRSPGTCRQTMIHDGRFLQSEFVFEQAGRKSTGLGLTGFEPQIGPIHHRLDRFPPDPHVVPPEPRAVRRQTDRLVQPVVRGSRYHQRPGAGRLLADRQPDRGQRPADRSSSVQHRPDGKERLIMELVLTRRAKNSPSSRR